MNFFHLNPVDNFDVLLFLKHNEKHQSRVVRTSCVLESSFACAMSTRVSRIRHVVKYLSCLDVGEKRKLFGCCQK